jgi:non-ribosomal peptide synthase protein (TIGR01720 family)
VALVNAYGPAECADDVSLWRVEEAPGADVLAMPIGRATDNNRLYVLDEELQRVAVGVVGEVCVAGVGVGRGYLGEGGKTAEAFVPHPYGASGERLYRTGDLARQRWDGALEYVGRRDQQVKVRGYRIELGEIEARLSLEAGVKEAAVLARSTDGGPKRLVAYVVLQRSVAAPERDDERASVSTLKARLGQLLPEYMVPAQWVVLSALPLSANGKVDRKALPEPDSSDTQRQYRAPAGDEERALAEIWQTLLRTDRIGRDDHFFELGGDSIVALQLVSRAKRVGLSLQPRDVFEHPTLSALALVATPLQTELADANGARRDPSGVRTKGGRAAPSTDVGSALLLPSQAWFFEQKLARPAHFNQSLLLSLPASLEMSRIERALQALVARHPELDARFVEAPSGWQRSPGVTAPRLLEELDLSYEPAPHDALQREAERAQRSLDLAKGPIFRALHLKCGDESSDRLLLVAHHLAVDAVSWRVLVEDLEAAYEDPSVLARRPAERVEVPTAAQALYAFADAPEAEAERAFYAAQLAGQDALPTRHPGASNDTAAARTLTVRLGVEESRQLVQAAPRAYRTQTSDLLLTALAEAFCAWSGSASLTIQLGTHGRGLPGIEASRAVGWFAGTYPVRLTPRLGEPASSIKTIKEQLRAVPRQGMSYGALRSLGAPGHTLGELERRSPARVHFNHFGSIPNESPAGLFRWSSDARGSERAGENVRDSWFDVGTRIIGESLEVSLRYGSRLHDEAEA